MESFFAANRTLWDQLTDINLRSDFYDVAGFKAGQTSLNSIEMNEVGDVTGKTLLHLQCHFGMDTLSWARLGAITTGIDMSENAIDKAKKLSREVGTESRFICTNIYDLPDHLNETFDIVFTSYGALCWLPDLKRWGEVIKRFVKPGGFFYMAEFHPVAFMLDEDGKTLKYPYFETHEPLKFEGGDSYADPSVQVKQTSYEWTHSLSEVINALVSTGLTLEYVHEYPYSVYNCWTYLTESQPGQWVVKDYPHLLPLMYSLKARYIA